MSRRLTQLLHSAHSLILFAAAFVPMACSNDAVTGIGKLESPSQPSFATGAAIVSRPQIVASANGTCGLSTAAAATCWGDYSADLPPLIAAKQISAGLAHYCALLTSGVVRCWGDPGITLSAPAGLGDLSPVIAVSAGARDSCALLADGSVTCWGLNIAGQGTMPPDVGPVQQIGVGFRHNCAIKVDATVACWGDDGEGQTDVPVGLGTVSMLSVAENSNCAVKTAGTVVCWGNPGFGLQNVPAGLTAVVRVVGANRHACAIKSDGGLVCWGANSLGQSTVPVGLVGVVDVGLGESHTCAVRNDGSLVCWGEYRQGQSAVPAGLNLGATISPNVAPVASPGGPYAGPEGSVVSLSLTGSDADADDVITYSWDLGDGTVGSGTAAPATHVYGDNGSYIITLKATDNDGESDSKTTSVTIVNVAPSLGPISAPDGPVAIVSSVSVSALVSDTGSADTHSAVVTWGDGNTTPVDALEGTIAASHIYGEAGVYTVDITAVDDDGGVSNSSTFEYVVIYDPSGGFVTGRGWINSPKGAFVQGPSLVGQASFGFVSKYKKGAQIPSGDTEFRFTAASLLFVSTTYEWMVVAGSKAQFKGEGTVNGQAGYKFILTAQDGKASPAGGPDRLRIKITDASGGLVYDNQMNAADDAAPTTAIGGGRIAIHSK
jgi:PKD repeat protein/alpha-tubulin suppressor-like RCC1 family protein